MKKLIWTSKFLKASEKLLNNNPELINQFKNCIKLLEENPFIPSLRTHKLKGKLSEFYSSSLNFSFRIVFELKNNDIDTIILLNIGRHDEVY